MRTLTQEEIERIVEAQMELLFEDAETETMFEYIKISMPQARSSLRTALATVQLDQPKIDLREVEELIYGTVTSESEADFYRTRIGYTLNDLTP